MEPISGIHFTYILVGFLEVRFQRLPSSSPLMTSQLCYTLLRRCGEHEHHTLVNDKKNHARSQGPSLRGSTHEGGARAVPDRRQITAKKSKREASCKLQEGDDDDSLSLSLSLSLSIQFPRPRLQERSIEEVAVAPVPGSEDEMREFGG